MDLRSVRFAVTLAEELHFGRAARRHFIAAQAFDRHIGRLERELGVRLFDRTSRRVVLTAAGAVFTSRARTLLAGFDELGAEWRTRPPSAGPRFSVGVLGFGAADRWLVLRSAVRAQLPGAQLEFRELDLEDQYSAVRDGMVDVALVHYVGEVDGIDFLPRAVKLASNEVAYPPLPAVLEAVAGVSVHVNRYPDNGAAVLTGALAQRYGVESAQVATGCGAVTVVQQIAQAFCEAGTALAYSWRSFEMYPLLAQVAGARGVQVPLRAGADGGSADTHDLEALLAAIDHTTRVVLVCNPNNPTGTAVPRTELEAFLDAVGEETLVVLDEAYREFVTDPDVPDGVELMRGRPNVAVLRTFSKAWGLAGLRVGYLLAEDPAVAEAVRKTHVPFSVSMVAQAAAVAALASEDEVRARVAEVTTERDRLTTALRERGQAVADSQANFVWLPLGEHTAEVAAALESRAVITRPFVGEGLRVTVGTPEENDVFLAALDAVTAEDH